MKQNYLLFSLLLTAMSLNAQNISPDTNYTTTTVIVGPNLKENTVFRAEQHWVKQERAGGYKVFATAPREHDYMYYEPSQSSPNTKGYLILNHERSVLKTERPQLGEGGGMSKVNVEKVGDTWQIVNDPIMKDTSISIDFSTVGWTTINCGGAKLPTGNHLTGEEIFDTYNSNKGIEKLHDTLQAAYGYNGDGTYTIPASYPEFGGSKIKMNENFGWMTEVNPNTAKAVRKCYHMGRFSHEGGAVAPDGKTIYLTDDYTSPASVLFKFVADVANDYSKGNLYAFKQTAGAYTGTWVQIERNLNALINAREVAMSKGATLFARLEWADYVNGKVYFAETGMDDKDISTGLTKGGGIPKHWLDGSSNGFPAYNATTKRIDHPYGSVLVLDDSNPAAPSVRAHLNGGTPSHGKFNFASVDGINHVTIGNKTYLALQEDIIGRSRGRVRPNFTDGVKNEFPYVISEAFFLDAAISNPTLEDLKLVFVSSQNAEVTGMSFTPDGNTMFVNNQHPEDGRGNTAPYDKSATIAVTGLAQAILAIPEVNESAPEMVVYPNPIFQTLHFNKTIDAVLYDINGREAGRCTKSSEMNVVDLPTGEYFLKTSTGGVHKVIKK